jgi:acetolactate synthase-1/2/3 large subunit
MQMVTGGQILVKTLESHGVQRAFCVAGESYLPVLDALLDYPHIDVVTCRQESGATFAAEAYGLLTGKPGIAMVTRGPGACNASIGVHAAKQSSAPMVMFVGLVRTEDRGKEAFQEFDLPQMFDSHTKWSAVIDRADQIADFVTRAMHIAVSGRPGPVVLGLPEEILPEMVIDVVPAPIVMRRPAVSAADVSGVVELLSAAERPLIIAGGSCWSDQACADLGDFAAASHIPVSASFRRQDLVDHNAGHYVGELGTGPNPALVAAVKRADVVLVLGARINEMMAQSYTLFTDEQKLIHVYPSPDEIGKAYTPELSVQAEIADFMAALVTARVDGRSWAGWRDELRAQYVEWSAIERGVDAGWNGAGMTQIFAQIRDVLPDDAIVTTDAGNFSGWCQRYLRYGRPNRLLAPLSGAMGYCVPSAVSASLECPDRVVLGFCGDGGFMMTGMEIATAMHHGAKPIIMVCNNAMYGTIRMHQQRDFPERISGTALTNPDFVALAQSYGAFGARITHADQFEDVWAQALAADRLALIEVQMDPRQITTAAKP